MNKRIFAIIFLSLLYNFAIGQLVSVTQNFKYIVNISNNINDSCVANMLNTLSVDASESINNTNFTIYYTVSVSDLLYLTCNKPVGSIYYSGFDIAEYLMPSYAVINCGNFNETVFIKDNIATHSFERPRNVDMAKCKFIYTKKDLDDFNQAVYLIQQQNAIAVIADTLIYRINDFIAKNHQNNIDNAIFKIFTTSQVDFLNSSFANIRKEIDFDESSKIAEKLHTLQARANVLNFSGEMTNSNCNVKTLSEKFLDNYLKWEETSNSCNYLYSNMIMMMGSFDETEPDILSIQYLFDENQAKLFVQSLDDKLFAAAQTAFDNNNIILAVSLSNNLKYLEREFKYKSDNNVNGLLIMCYQNMSQTYKNFARSAKLNGHYELADEYEAKAAAAYIETMNVEEKNLVTNDTVSNQIAINVDEYVQNFDNQFVVEEVEKVANQNKVIDIVEDIAETDTIKSAVGTTTSSVEASNTDKPEDVAATNIDNCDKYTHNLKVLEANIDKYTLFTVENLFNKYNREYSDCNDMDFEQWIDAIGRKDLLPKKSKKRNK